MDGDGAPGPGLAWPSWPNPFLAYPLAVTRCARCCHRNGSRGCRRGGDGPWRALHLGQLAFEGLLPRAATRLARCHRRRHRRRRRRHRRRRHRARGRARWARSGASLAALGRLLVLPPKRPVRARAACGGWPPSASRCHSNPTPTPTPTPTYLPLTGVEMRSRRAAPPRRATRSRARAALFERAAGQRLSRRAPAPAQAQWWAWAAARRVGVEVGVAVVGSIELLDVFGFESSTPTVSSGS